jgi:methylglutaconyl-CoA hydratase
MGDTSISGSLTTALDGRLAVISFGHPSSNSLNSSLLDRLCAEIDALGKTENISVILIQSEGERAFCAGASFDELLLVENPQQSAHFFGGFARLINSMRKCPKPIVGKVHGKAVGGGVGLIAACDYVLASAEAAIRLSEISIGIAPLVIEPAVSRKIGVAGTASLSLNPTEWKTAEWACERGLYTKIIADPQTLQSEAIAFAQGLATYPTEALCALKKVLWEGTDHWDTLLMERAQITGRLALSQTTQELLKQFKQKNNR